MVSRRTWRWASLLFLSRLMATSSSPVPAPRTPKAQGCEAWQLPEDPQLVPTAELQTTQVLSFHYVLLSRSQNRSPGGREGTTPETSSEEPVGWEQTAPLSKGPRPAAPASLLG